MSVSTQEPYNYDTCIELPRILHNSQKVVLENARFLNNINVLLVMQKAAQICHFEAHVCICITVFAFF